MALPMLAALVVAGGMAWSIRRWAGAPNWTDRQLVALASGALIAHTAVGMLVHGDTTISLVGLAALGVVEILP